MRPRAWSPRGSTALKALRAPWGFVCSLMVALQQITRRTLLADSAHKN
jgi:hypothetical protein